jgi:hypothetical protein
MKTKFIKIDGWNDVLDACRHTVSKAPLNKTPSEKFKKDILIAEHGPVREVVVKWLWEQIPSWVSVHWVRHKWECYVATQRSDRTGIPREKLPQDAPVNFMGSANAQNTIDSWRKRLCYKASPETRKLAEDFKEGLYENFEREWSDCLQKNCVYRCGCPEMEECPAKAWETWMRKTGGRIGTSYIQDRYDVYHELFYGKEASANAESE